MCLISGERTQKQDPNELLRGGFCGSKGGPKRAILGHKEFSLLFFPALMDTNLKAPTPGTPPSSPLPPKQKKRKISKTSTKIGADPVCSDFKNIVEVWEPHAVEEAEVTLRSGECSENFSSSKRPSTPPNHTLQRKTTTKILLKTLLYVTEIRHPNKIVPKTQFHVIP